MSKIINLKIVYYKKLIFLIVISYIVLIAIIIALSIIIIKQYDVNYLLINTDDNRCTPTNTQYPKNPIKSRYEKFYIQVEHR